MSAVALWIGWAVIGVGGLVAAAAVIVFVPYLILDRLWARLKVMDDFIAIAVRYFDEKGRKDRSIMRTPE